MRIDPENQYTWKTMRIGRIGERGQFDVLWSSERPMRPEPFASSRLPGSWSAFLDDLHRRWDGHWSGKVAVWRPPLSRARKSGLSIRADPRENRAPTGGSCGAACIRLATESPGAR